MARRNNNLIKVLFDSPWWVGVLVSVSVYLLLTGIMPLFLPYNDSIYTKPLTEGFSFDLTSVAPIIAGVFLIPALFSFLRSFGLTGGYQETSDEDDLNRLNWIEFEGLLGEHYRQLGYQVNQAFSQQPDDGVDIELTKFGQISLVQCKHWRSRKVGVKVIREMYGVLLEKKADKMIIVTSGEFTLDAYRFAQGKKIKLINGTQLTAMLAQTHKEPVQA